jgi:probable F420-dependent oxidoreductase
MPVKISTGLPNCREGRQNPVGSVDLTGMLRVARVADELGYHALWPNEFQTTFPTVAAKYAAPPSYYDTIVTMAYAAQATARIRIAPSTIVLPLHEPILLSRQLATLDVFSGGRVTLGIGLGGDEFRRLRRGVTAPNRGQMMEEYLQALRVLWTERRATFEGHHVSFADVESYPKPLQNPLPILMAGHADGVFRRLAAHGQGWIDSSNVPDELRRYVDRLRRYAAEAGRGDAHFEISRQFYVSIAETEEAARANHRAALPAPTKPPAAPAASPPAAAAAPAPPSAPQERDLVGTPDQIVPRLKAYESAGVTELVAIFYYPDAAAAERQLRLFAKEVMPAFA